VENTVNNQENAESEEPIPVQIAPLYGTQHLGIWQPLVDVFGRDTRTGVNGGEGYHLSLKQMP
jgi:hypothetical protein